MLFRFLKIENYPLFFYKLANRSDRCANRHKNIAVSSSLTRFMISNGILESKMTVILKGINPKAFNLKINGTNSRKSLKISDKVVAGFVGRICNGHGLDVSGLYKTGY